MHIMKKAAASMSAVGLLAFGLVAGDGGSALARVTGPVVTPAVTGSGTSVAGCSAQYGTLALGLFPNCTAADATVKNPTSIAITLNTTSLGALVNAIPGLGMKATWMLSCDVDGSSVSSPGSLTVTSTAQSATKTIDLQAAMGSPEPNSCTISQLTATTTLGLDLAALGLGLLTVGVAATADIAVPGAIYQSEGTTSAGASAVLCADDTGDGNSGSKIQAYQCLSDLADYWVLTSAGQLVHNGDCMTASGGLVSLATCTAGEGAQKWSQSTVNGELMNQGSCLTATSVRDFTQLAVKSCAGKASQKWHLPLATV